MLLLTRTVLVLVLAVVVSLLSWSSRAQDLQYHCITCEDKFDRCELDCAWSLQDRNVTDVTACQDDCLYQKQTCVDKATTTKCTSCALTCSESYDADMRRCLASITRSTKATYGSTLSECEILASFDMDSCMNHCAPSVDTTDDYLDDFNAQ